MARYNPETKEQVKNLKDGRVIFKTHNGFKYWVTTKNGTTETNEGYYQRTKHLEV